MTKEHALTAYKNFEKQVKDLSIKDIWRRNAQRGMDSILIRHPEFKDISEEKEKEPIKSKGKK